VKYVPILLILPLVSAFLAPALGIVNKKFGRFFNPILYGLGIFFGILLFINEYPESHLIVIGGWRPPFGINLYISPLSYIGIIGIYLLAFFIHIADIENPRSSYYNLLFALFVFSSLGVVLTGDIFNLFIFLEIGSVAVIALSSAVSERAGTRAAVKYMVPSNLVAMFMLIGIALLYSSLGTLNIAHITASQSLNGAIALVIGLSIFTSLFFEAELFPFNTWVPDVYKGSASTFSAALSGIGGLASALVLGRLFLTMMGPESSFKLASNQLSSILYIVATASILIGEFSALKERDVKKVLAFSSVGQMGLVALAFATRNPLAVSAGIILLVNHSFAKPLLMIVAGFFVKTTNETRWDDMRGVARQYPMMGVLFIIAALSLMGMPFFMGFWGKIELVKSLLDGGVLAWVGFGAILISVIVEGAYFVRMSHAFFEQPTEDIKIAKMGKMSIIIPICVLVTVIIILGIFPSIMQGFANHISSDLLNSNGYINNIIQSVSSAGVEL